MITIYTPGQVKEWSKGKTENYHLYQQDFSKILDQRCQPDLVVCSKKILPGRDTAINQ